MPGEVSEGFQKTPRTQRGICLREFALCYERHTESVRMVLGVCPAGRDSTSAVSAVCAE